MLTKAQWEQMTAQQQLDYLLSLYVELTPEQQWVVVKRLGAIVEKTETSRYDREPDAIIDGLEVWAVPDLPDDDGDVP